MTSTALYWQGGIIVQLLICAIPYNLTTMIVISYSRKNKDVVLPLVSVLKAAGNDIFIDIQDMKYGKEWDVQISDAINKTERMLIFWSRFSDLSSEVEKEWKLCLKTPNCRIVPILLDKTPLPSTISKYHGTNELQPLVNKIKSNKRKWLITKWILASLIVSLISFILFFAFEPNSDPCPVPCPAQLEPLSLIQNNLTILMILSASTLLLIISWILFRNNSIKMYKNLSTKVLPKP